MTTNGKGTRFVRTQVRRVHTPVSILEEGLPWQRNPTHTVLGVQDVAQQYGGATVWRYFSVLNFGGLEIDKTGLLEWARGASGGYPYRLVTMGHKALLARDIPNPFGKTFPFALLDYGTLVANNVYGYILGNPHDDIDMEHTAPFRCRMAIPGMDVGLLFYVDSIFHQPQRRYEGWFYIVLPSIPGEFQGVVGDILTRVFHGNAPFWFRNTQSNPCMRFVPMERGRYLVNMIWAPPYTDVPTVVVRRSMFNSMQRIRDALAAELDAVGLTQSSNVLVTPSGDTLLEQDDLEEELALRELQTSAAVVQPEVAAAEAGTFELPALE